MAETMAPNADERELLRRYVEAGDVQAFRQLVDAHRNMVFSVCRRILHNAADAEDAAQDCFLQLARKAGTLRPPIAGWVHQVALYVAMDYRERKAQREGRESMAAKMRSEVGDPNWEELQGVVDEAVSGLPERLRIPLVLHYLEGRTQQEVAAQLRISQPAVSQRLTKGLELLRKRLKRQGFVASCAVLGALFSAHAIEAAPPALSDSAAKIGFSALAAGAKAAGGTALTIGGLSVFKASLVSVVAVSALVAGGIMVHNALAQNPTPASPAVTVAPPPVPAMAPAEKVTLRSLHPLGNYITVIESEGEQRTTADGRTETTQFSPSFTILMQVEKADEQGGKKITITYKAIKFKISQPGMDVFFDSEKPDVEGGAPQELAAAFRPLLDVRIVALLDADGKVTDVKGASEAWDKLSRNHPANEILIKSMKEQMGDEFIRRMIEIYDRALPPNPVSRRDVWMTQTDISVPFTGKVDFRQRNQFAGLVRTAQGLMAGIHFDGQITQTQDRQVDLGGAKATCKKLVMQLAGNCKFNIKSGMSVSSETHQDADIDMVWDQQGQTTDMTIKSQLTTRTTTREATPEDLKPRTTAVAATAGPAPASAAVMKVAEGNNAFALDLYAKLKAEPGNLFFSPYSISTALAMTYAGARGETEKQMAKTLHFDLSQAELHPAFAELNKQEGSSGDYQLSVANALWGQEGFAFLPEFIKLTEEQYGAPLQQVDFAASQQTAKTINDWVEAKTDRKITQLVSADALDPLMTRLVLTNAIYFKGTWESQFRKDWTRDGAFTKIDGTKVTVRMMHPETSEFPYVDLGSCQVLQLPYAGGRLSMLILLPKKALDEVESQLTAPTLANWIGNLVKQKIDLSMPKFTMNCRFDLGNTLAALGIKDAFSLPPADFSGMTGRKDLFISKVLHKAFVDVNEEGTEAAAATAQMMSLGAEHLIEFRADHPFIFLIRDEKTGSILFMGRVMNPKENEDNGGVPADEAQAVAPVMNQEVMSEGLAILGAIRGQENLFRTEKGVYLAVASGDVSNEVTDARPGLGLDLSWNIHYFDANCIGVALDAKYGWVATCDGTMANNAAPRKADARTYIIQERGNGETRISADSGTTFTPWK